MGKQKGKTEKGTTYTLLQDAPNRIHLTLQDGNYLMYDVLENLTSESQMIERRTILEEEFIAWVNSKSIPETTDEATS